MWWWRRHATPKAACLLSLSPSSSVNFPFFPCSKLAARCFNWLYLSVWIFHLLFTLFLLVQTVLCTRLRSILLCLLCQLPAIQIPFPLFRPSGEKIFFLASPLFSPLLCMCGVGVKSCCCCTLNRFSGVNLAWRVWKPARALAGLNKKERKTIERAHRRMMLDTYKSCYYIIHILSRFREPSEQN